MKQLFERLESGELHLSDVPLPSAGDRHLVVRTHASVVSAGTERMLLGFGRANVLEKARQQPERMRKVLEKARTDGVVAAWEAVRARLEEPLPLGYCQAGTVVDVGAGCEGFEPGDRVATNGPHAEGVRVPRTMAARVPDGVSFEEAAFTPLGAIALQGIRNASPTLGETVVVFGLGLVGLLTVQLLRAHGCQVLGLDLLEDRRELARDLGARVPEEPDDVVDWVRAETDGRGADAVLLTLESDSDEPVRQAADMSREKGRIVLVGVTGLELRRSDFYDKELSFTVSRSYGPGRYDSAYEEKGLDYPLPYVRWTARRNFEVFLRLIAEREVQVEPLISHRFPIEKAPEAYELLLNDVSNLGIVLIYGENDGSQTGEDTRIRVRSRKRIEPRAECVAGLIGAGGFARRVLLPELAELPVRLRCVCAPSGTSAGVAGRRFDFETAASDPADVWADEAINTVFVLTRHDSHADLVARALEAGKHVFVEKPLAITAGALERLEEALGEASGLLTVGFNRRFAPATRAMADELEGRYGPLSLQITVNAGRLDEHWLLDPEVGGGRLIGEGCHFVDLARALTGSPISDWTLRGDGAGIGAQGNDPWHLGLSFEDGSVASIHYLPTGASSYPKERVEAFFDGKTFLIDNWRRLKGYGGGPLLSLPSRQDKGHRGELEAWIEAVTQTGEPPIPYEELFEVTRVTLEAAGRA